ncbi:hypothetical protein PAHAL_9G393400 [Panicum hallii]|uniref:Uncharacterized protein n=1 Tax=Panicum hallii TaxID=206008 RepID=A0A2T8I412_9POAL|nr:hypothetical protein PAHAL_9G393400 [Panicum hallii]
MLVQRHIATVCRLREKRASVFITIGFEYCNAAIKWTGQDANLQHKLRICS